MNPLLGDIRKKQCCDKQAGQGIALPSRNPHPVQVDAVAWRVLLLPTPHSQENTEHHHVDQPGIRAAAVPSSALPIHSGAFREDRGFTSIGSVVQKAAHQETATGAMPVQRAMSVTSRKEGMLFSG